MARYRYTRFSIAASLLALLGACAGAPEPGDAAAATDLPEREVLVDERLDSPKPGTRGEAAPAPAMMYDSGAAKSLGGASARRPTPGSSGLKAGYSDDNAQFGYFLDFLEKYRDVEHYAYDVSERLTIRVIDTAGLPVANAVVTVSSGGAVIASGLSYADGSFRLYPAALGLASRSYDVSARHGGREARTQVKRDGPRLVELRLALGRVVPEPLPLDVLFVMDTTGSMGEEIERLKATIDIIHDNLLGLRPRTRVRFGLVLYKDRGDEYVTSLVPFTDDVEAFRARLDPVYASGGGDGPEDLESALDDAVNAMDWNRDGLRLGFVVTDAEAHLDYGREYTYIKAANDARAKAIKLFTIGTGGLPLAGEYLLRQVSQLTDARYIFLTYGERGESEGGAPGSVSHHTGANFQTDKLEAIIIRFVKEEVAHFGGDRLEGADDYYSARPIDEESREETLAKLFREAMGSLADYSTFRVTPETACAILPVQAVTGDLAPTAEYFGERLAMASTELKRWRTVERKDLQKVLAELELQLSGLADETKAAEVGRLLGAELLVAPTLYRRGEEYELFLRLVRVSTAEILAVTRARLDLGLGL